MQGSRANGRGAAGLETAVWVGVTASTLGRSEVCRDLTSRFPFTPNYWQAGRRSPVGRLSGDMTQEGLKIGMIVGTVSMFKCWHVIQSEQE